MTDRFANNGDSMNAPAFRDFDITPHATDPLAEVTRAIYVGSGGNLVVKLVDSGSDRTYVAVPTGTILPVRATHVRATSTAGSLVGMV